jgi:putative flippase GtrA
MSTARLARLIRFGLVGCLGFFVDLGVIFALIRGLRLDPLSARIPAWIVAVSTTYILNLLFTFRSTKLLLGGKKQRLLRYGFYGLSQLGGGVVNVLAYALVVSMFSFPWSIGLVIGTLMGMIFNYIGASAVISRHQGRRV